MGSEMCIRDRHIRVDVEQEHHIDDRDELRRKFYRTSRPDEDKEEELEEICIGEVDIVDMPCEACWEHHSGPVIVAGGLHEVEDEQGV